MKKYALAAVMLLTSVATKGFGVVLEGIDNSPECQRLLEIVLAMESGKIKPIVPCRITVNSRANTPGENCKATLEIIEKMIAQSSQA